MASGSGSVKTVRSIASERPPALRFHLFGHARMSVDGEPARLATPRKTLPVLAYLLIHREAAVSRNFLAFTMWPDESEESARAKLRATLHDLARVLPAAPDGHWIELEGTNVRWNPDAAVTVDVDDFEAAIVESARLSTAADLYTGDFLEAVYDEWTIAPRERYRSAYVGALEQLVSQCRRRLDFPAAIEYARRLLATDPLREDVARRLIALRYEAGDRAGALEEYERFERRIKEELDIEPMPETAALREAIARNDAATAVEDHLEESAPPAQSRATLPFVGRTAELELLVDAWNRTARSRGGVIFVGGEPGIGKSRLVAEFMRHVDERGGRIIFGATGSPETMPYQAFVEAMRSALPLIAGLRIDAVWLAVLATLLPELTARVVDLPEIGKLEPENERARLFGALTRALVALAQPRPLLVVLEDLHWAEEATIAALSFVARRIALAPLMMVATYRDTETVRRHPLRRARNDAITEGYGRSLNLRPLSVSDVDAMTNMLGSASPGPAPMLHLASEGNPLLLGQLLEDPVALRAEAPARVGDVIEARLARLSPEARRLADIASLIGQRFSGEVVREAGGWDQPTFDDALDELLDRRIVREATGRGALDYAFAHQTVRDVVAGNVSAERSRDRHRRIARVLEDLFPDRVAEFAAELGRHYENAGEADEAADRYLAAARRATAVAALDEAASHLDRALELAQGAPLRVRLLIDRADLARRTGDRHAMGAAITQLAALAESTDDDETRRQAWLLRAQLAAQTEDAPMQREALDALSRLVSGAGPKWRAAVALEEARAAHGRSDLEALRQAASAALEAAKQSGDRASAARATAWLANLAVNRGKIAQAQELLDAAQAEAVRAGDGAAEIDSLRSSFVLSYNTGDVDRCVAIASQWLERGIAMGDRLAEGDGRLRMAIALLSARRDIRRVRTELANAKAIFTELGSPRGIAGVLINGALLENEVGNFEGAMQLTEQSLELMDRLNDARGKATALSNLGVLRAATGDIEGGLRDAKAGIEVARSASLLIHEACAVENLAVATAFAGDVAEAVRLAEQALAMHRGLESSKWIGRLLGDLAVWHAQLGDLAAARSCVDQMFEQGVQVWAEWPQRFYWAAAQVMHASGDEAGAREQLQRAHQLVADMAAQIPEDDRARYRSVPWNLAIIAALERHEWPTLPSKKRSRTR